MPKMLSMDERFEAIIAETAPRAKMNPLREPDPEQGPPVERKPAESVPEKETPGQDE